MPAGVMAMMNIKDGARLKRPRKPLKEAPATWLETLFESDEDIAAGRVVPVDDVLKELDDMISHISNV